MTVLSLKLYPFDKKHDGITTTDAASSVTSLYISNLSVRKGIPLNW